MQEIIYKRLLANWPQADAILQLSLMEIADEIAKDLKEKYYFDSKATID